MTVLEDRLRGELRAESELITPESIVPLRLPDDTGDGPGLPWRGGARQWPSWVVPLAAAAAAVAAIAGTFALARVLPGNGPRPASPKLSSVPAYYAYTVQGSIYHYVSHGTQYGASVTGRYLKVRDTATGKLVTTVFPPKPYNNFEMITANASGTMFVFGAMRNWERNANTPPRILRRNQVTPMKFVELRISPAGQARVSSLSLPVTVTLGQLPSMALSPTGARLALAFGGGGQPAVLDVISLGTGRMRRWVSPPVPWTPLLNVKGAWTADGQTLVLQEWDVIRTPARQAELRWHPPATTQVRLIDTLARGGSLAGRQLVLSPRPGESPPWQVFVTPDGTKLIGSIVTDSSRPLADLSRGELSVYSASTGALLQRLAPWKWNGNDPRGGHGGLPRELLAWSNPSGSQLILLHPRGDLNILGVLTGGRFRTAGTPLPQPAGYQELEYALRTAGQMAW
jgi:hypothetical protein